jgi:hypothetical protein
MAKRDFFDVLKETLSKGMKNIGEDVGAELSRLGKQGALEMAQALFNGAAFTPYGPGQWKSPEREGGPSEPEVQKAEREQDRGGREM